MSATERMTITMPAELAEALRAKVQDGEYASASDIIQEALRDWTRSRGNDRHDADGLRDAIRAGIDSGAGLPAEPVFAELRSRYAAKG